MRLFVRLLVAVVLLAASAGGIALHMGCSRPAAPPAPTTVRGRVTFQGQPVAGGLVVFTPDRDRGATGKPVRGEIGPDGAFSLQADGGSGVPPGWYRVAIAPAPGSPTAPAFPPQLRRPDRSTLVREVAPGQENVFEFAISVASGQ